MRRRHFFVVVEYVKSLIRNNGIWARILYGRAMHKNCIKVALKSWPARKGKGEGTTTTTTGNGNGHSKMAIKIISRPRCPAGWIVYAGRWRERGGGEWEGTLGDSTVPANGLAMITMCVCLNMSSTCRFRGQQ